jgi:hypothetical protein
MVRLNGCRMHIEMSVTVNMDVLVDMPALNGHVHEKMWCACEEAVDESYIAERVLCMNGETRTNI